MARPLKFQAGQFIYLSLKGISALSMFDFHPFQICWDYIDENERQVIVLLVQDRGRFSRKLLEAKPRSEPPYQAFIEGPYGKPLSVDQYGTVLLFATDMGIAGQLPYIRKLLQHYRECKIKSRRIAVFWERNESKRSCPEFWLC
jgi:NAD(P)H-flavin reductase